jgi:hypothetical protein
MSEPLDAVEVKRLTWAALSTGIVEYSSPAGEGEGEHGSWRYRMWTAGIVAVIAFRAATHLIVVTAWRKQR